MYEAHGLKALGAKHCLDTTIYYIYIRYDTNRYIYIVYSQGPQLRTPFPPKGILTFLKKEKTRKKGKGGKEGKREKRKRGTKEGLASLKVFVLFFF